VTSAAYESDKRDVAVISPGPRTAWLFTRGRDSVRLEAHVTANGAELRIYGPGTKRSVCEFRDVLALLVHEASLEQHLVAQGFILDEFVTDRRRHPRD
jgi:hypothetical protein